MTVSWTSVVIEHHSHPNHEWTKFSVLKSQLHDDIHEAIGKHRDITSMNQSPHPEVSVYLFSALLTSLPLTPYHHYTNIKTRQPLTATFLSLPSALLFRT